MPAGTEPRRQTCSHWVCENAEGAHEPTSSGLTTSPLVRADLAGHAVCRSCRARCTRKAITMAALMRQPLLAAGPARPRRRDWSVKPACPPWPTLAPRVVRAAHELGMQVVPLVGPVSPAAGAGSQRLERAELCVCGLCAARRWRARHSASGSWSRLALKTGQTQLFIETPYRNAAPAAGLAANPADQYPAGHMQRA